MSKQSAPQLLRDTQKKLKIKSSVKAGQKVRE
jgi:hypothetical protein